MIAFGKEELSGKLSVIGKILDGRYQIVSEIGRGANGTVYLALELNIHRRWAVKEVKKQSHVEAEILMRIEHAACVKIADSFTEDGRDYIVSEYIDGETMEQMVQECHRQVNEKQVLLWGMELAEILIYLHGLCPALIHRDIKPGNLMIDRDGHIRLIDFGIAMETGHVCGEQRAYGSVGFAAPEQYGDHCGRVKESIDARADIYAFGKTFRYVIRRGKVRVSVGMKLILLKCTYHKRIRRFQSASHLYGVLKLLYTVNYPNRTQMKRRILCVTGVTLLLCMSGIWNIIRVRESIEMRAATQMREMLMTEIQKQTGGVKDVQAGAGMELPPLDAERFWSDYDELRAYIGSTEKQYREAEPSVQKYEGLLELSRLYAAFWEESDEAVEAAIELTETGLEELDDCSGMSGGGNLNATECKRLQGEYCRQLFMQYRILGQQKLQAHIPGALEDMTAAAGYGERACEMWTDNEAEKAALICDLGRVYTQLGCIQEACTCYKRGIAELEPVPAELYIAYLELMVPEEDSDTEQLRRLYEQAMEKNDVRGDVRFERIRLQVEDLIKEEMN